MKNYKTIYIKTITRSAIIMVPFNVKCIWYEDFNLEHPHYLWRSFLTFCRSVPTSNNTPKSLKSFASYLVSLYIPIEFGPREVGRKIYQHRPVQKAGVNCGSALCCFPTAECFGFWFHNTRRRGLPNLIFTCMCWNVVSAWDTSEHDMWQVLRGGGDNWSAPEQGDPLGMV